MSSASDKTLPAIAGGTPIRATPLPFFRASIDDSDVKSVTDALRSGWLTVGPRTEQLEKAIREYVGARHAVAVNSCSAAMFLGLKALGIGPGDEVITSANTFASTVHAILHTGARPLLADIETETFGMDPQSVRGLLSPRTKALLPVHFGGQACRIDEIASIAREHDLALLEDAAHSFGAVASGRRVGDIGDLTAFSFYATKNLTTGEGGAITTNDDALAARLRLLSYNGMSRDSWTRYTDRGSWYYEVELPGYKCNMSDLLAALGLSQLARFGHLLAERRRVAGRLHERLGESPFWSLPAERQGNVHTWHLYVVSLQLERLSIDRAQFISALAAENVASSVHFIPVHRHPFFREHLRQGDTFPVCDDYFARCISLPLYPDMTDDDVDDVAGAMEKIARHFRAG